MKNMVDESVILDDIFGDDLEEKKKTPYDYEYNFKNDNKVITICLHLYDSEDSVNFKGKIIFMANKQKKVIDLDYTTDDIYIDRNAVQLKLVEDALGIVNAKNKPRNIIFSSNADYFDSLFKYKRLFKFKEQNWTKKDGSEMPNKEILENIYNLITNMSHSITHYRYTDMKNLMENEK